MENQKTISIPKIGLGTWCITNEEVSSVVKQAISVGYRHIDTAQAYANEEGVGKGIQESGIQRTDIFLTTKIAAENKTYESAMQSIDGSLQKLQVSYIDMLLIHSPQPWSEVNQSSNRYLKENIQVYKAMEDAFKQGKVKAIGVSNFLQEDLDNILQHATIKPIVNQILCHISNTPHELIEYCKKNGILVEAYSPIAHGEILKNTQLQQIAAKYQVNVAQLCIRYDLQLGTIVIPKSTSLEHLKSNLDINFTISEEDMHILEHIPPIQDYGEFSKFPVYGGKK